MQDGQSDFNRCSQERRNSSKRDKRYSYTVGTKVLTTTARNSFISWDITLLAAVSGRFPAWHTLQPWRRKRPCSSKTSVDSQRTTQPYIQQREPHYSSCYEVSLYSESFHLWFSMHGVVDWDQKSNFQVIPCSRKSINKIMARDTASTPFRVWRCASQMEWKHASQGHVTEPGSTHITLYRIIAKRRGEGSKAISTTGRGGL
jgi:hypothetical protein